MSKGKQISIIKNQDNNKLENNIWISYYQKNPYLIQKIFTKKSNSSREKWTKDIITVCSKRNHNNLYKLVHP